MSIYQIWFHAKSEWQKNCFSTLWTKGNDVKEAICSFTNKTPSFEKFSSKLHHLLVFMKKLVLNRVTRKSKIQPGLHWKSKGGSNWKFWNAKFRIRINLFSFKLDWYIAYIVHLICLFLLLPEIAFTFKNNTYIVLFNSYNCVGGCWIGCTTAVFPQNGVTRWWNFLQVELPLFCKTL